MNTTQTQPQTIPVTDFKAHCTAYLRAIENGAPPIQITRHGKIVAIVDSPPASEDQNFLGAGKATATLNDSYDPHAPAFDEDDWEMNK